MMDASGSTPAEALERVGLTGRECDVFWLVAERLRNREIADRLYVSERTVASHVASILRKLDAHDRAEVISLAAQLRAEQTEAPVLTSSPFGASGAIAFLFTDIVGSTRRWEDDPSMSAALARHDEVVRGAIQSNRGRLLKHTGDGALGVFASAADAVVASVEAQRRLVAAGGVGAPLRVRMAVHTGEVEERDGDYFGPVLNRAARLASAANGGQVLVSLATEELVNERLPAGVELISLGVHHLKDLHRPERVFQVVADGLRRAFPPLATAVEVPTNLPVPRTSFVGRHDDLARIDALLGDHRLVTLVGVGGAGKTRLAIEAGHRVLGRFRGGVFFVDLSSLVDGDGIIGKVAEAMGMGPSRVPAVDDAGLSGVVEDDVVTFLADRNVVAIVDNCEHLLDDCAGLVDRLLVAAPALVVLVTSREALAIDGEQIVQVRSLSLPDDEDGGDSEALRLLVDRMASVRPDFAVTPDNRQPLVEICVRLDGIPLALELAAARAGHLGPREIADRLGDRFRLLGGGRRRVQRQQTLQATVDWSYHLLSADEQAVLRRLAVFVGGFALDAVDGICLGGIEGRAVDVVGSLVAKSLVVAGERGRYRLLETIRLYAEDKLALAGEPEATRSRHRDWFLARLEDESLERCLVSNELAIEMEPDADNLRAALAWSDAQNRHDLLRRMLLRVPPWTVGWLDRAGGHDRWVRRALEHERDLPRDQWHCHVRAEAQGMGGLFWAGDYAANDEALQRLQVLTDDLPDGETITAYAHLQQALLLSVFPQRAAEIEHAADLAIAHAGTDNPLVANLGVWTKAAAYVYQYRYEEAGALLESQYDSDSALGLVRHLQGRHREALELTDVEASGAWQPMLRYERITAAVATAALGDTRAARQRLQSLAVSIRRQPWRSDPLALSDCLVGFAALAALDGDHQRAARLIATIPRMTTGTQWLFALLRHYRDLAREHLDPDTRRDCITDGRATAVDDALDAELAAWEVEATSAPPSPPNQ